MIIISNNNNNNNSIIIRVKIKSGETCHFL